MLKLSIFTFIYITIVLKFFIQLKLFDLVLAILLQRITYIKKPHLHIRIFFIADNLVIFFEKNRHYKFYMTSIFFKKNLLIKNFQRNKCAKNLCSEIYFGKMNSFH